MDGRLKLTLTISDGWPAGSDFYNVRIDCDGIESSFPVETAYPDRAFATAAGAALEAWKAAKAIAIR